MIKDDKGTRDDKRGKGRSRNKYVYNRRGMMHPTYDDTIEVRVLWRYCSSSSQSQSVLLGGSRTMAGASG